MSYPDVDEYYIQKVINRKEFLITQQNKKPETELDREILDSGRLLLRSYQLFARNYFNINTPVKRLYVKYGTGIGKTILALNIAVEFIKYQFDENSPKYSGVYIIGFTKRIFQRELLKYPEFGFITRDELRTLEKLKYIAATGSETDRQRFLEMFGMLKRRISNRKVGGYFHFYGYREFANRVFDDEKFQQKLAGCLCICDEIHNVYNSLDTNNWGSAIQKVLDYHGSNIRALFLSATPINHSPTEVIDLLNLLEIGKKHTRAEFFNGTELKKDAAENLGRAFSGKLLFLESSDKKHFPTATMSGVEIKGIPVLRFIQCRMSEYQEKSYNLAYNNGTIPTDAIYIMDIAFPNPDGKTGIYKTPELKALAGLKLKFPGESGDFMTVTTTSGLTISGDFLKMEKLGKYSVKYHTMMQDILQLIKRKAGKILIYHKYVRMSGIFLIKEILLRNGCIEEFSEPNQNTLDCFTGKTLEEMQKDGTADSFRPLRIGIIYAEIDQMARDNTLEKFNSRANAYGEEMMILLGADIIKESYDFQCVRNLFVMSRPDDISTLLQIFGRAKRYQSHAYLPENLRTVEYRIYVSSLLTRPTYEEEKYADNIEKYQVIQKIEQIMHENAADSALNYPLIEDSIVRPGELGILPFRPKFNLRGDPISTTYDAYYTDSEINSICYIIKRLFMEVSTIFNLPDLIRYVKNPPFHLEINPVFLHNDNIKIAIYRLVYFYNRDYFTIIPESRASKLDQLFDPNEKIFTINGAEHLIISVNEFFMLTPYNRDFIYSNITFESPYRNFNFETKKIDLNIMYNINLSNYEIQKEHFINTFKDSPKNLWLDAICKYETVFHVKMIEEIVEYFYTNITNTPGAQKISEDLQKFYIDLLFYYEAIGDLIIYYDTAKDFIKNTYNIKCKSCESTTA